MRPALADEAWKRADVIVEWVIGELAERAGFEIAFVLTSGAAADIGTSTYVFFEPFADIVVALGYGDDGGASITATSDLWGRFRLRRAFEQLEQFARSAVRQGDLAGAVRGALHQAAASSSPGQAVMLRRRLARPDERGPASG